MQRGARGVQVRVREDGWHVFGFESGETVEDGENERAKLGLVVREWWSGTNGGRE